MQFHVFNFEDFSGVAAALAAPACSASSPNDVAGDLVVAHLVRIYLMLLPRPTPATVGTHRTSWHRSAYGTPDGHLRGEW